MGDCARWVPRTARQGDAPGAQGLPGKKPTPHCVLGCGAQRTKLAAVSRARRPPVCPGAQGTGRGGSHLTPPRPWGSPQGGACFLTSAARPAPRLPQPMACHSAPRATSARAAPANLRPPRGARRSIGYYDRPSDPCPAHLGQTRSIQLRSVTAAPATTKTLRSRPLPRPLSSTRWAWSFHTAPDPTVARTYLPPTRLHPNEAPTPDSKAPNSRPRPGV